MSATLFPDDDPLEGMVDEDDFPTDDDDNELEEDDIEFPEDDDED